MTGRGIGTVPRRGVGAVTRRAIGVLRAAGYAVLPAELALVLCLATGTRVPGWLLLAVEAGVVLLAAGFATVFVRLRRSGLTRRRALEELVPPLVLRLAGHELRLMRSLVWWPLGRRDGVGEGATAFGHARDQAALLFGFGFVAVVETVALSFLLRNVPTVHAVVLVLDVYTVLFVLGLHAAAVTRPHVLDDRTLRLRQGAHLDVRIPVALIASVRRETLFTHEKRDDVLDLPVGSQTSITLDLTEPATFAAGFLGRPRTVRTVRLHADDPKALYAAICAAVDTRGRTAGSGNAPPPTATATATATATRERTPPSPRPAPHG
ncbi:hypothetical protein [Streptomyces sp. t39]|uniref:hypothetical protein n=1 Tax=Streptomyces sp. t39 TaxID=1828156 RepID=UPI0021C9AF25|nr:hypothetical protein [Streptomyces sp. t39]